MQKQIINVIDINKEDLLKEIVDSYDYQLEINENKVICYDDIEEEESVYRYKNIDEALIDWLDTLIESEMNYRLNNDDITWIDEINFINTIKEEVCFNENSTIINDNLIYGEVPSFLNKRLSVVLEEQEKKINKYIDRHSDKNTNGVVQKLNLPIEFICNDKELLYVKIPNQEFIKRLMDRDYSEIENDEMDIYNKYGLVEMLPLMRVGSTSKFSLNMPMVLININKKIKVTGFIKYLHLF